MATRSKPMSSCASLSTLSSNQSINLPPIQSRYTPGSHQGITLPPIKWRDESKAGQPGVEWQKPDNQQLRPSSHSERLSQLPTEKGRRASALTRESGGFSILNPIGPDGSVVSRFHHSPNLATGSSLSAVDQAPPSISTTIHTFSGQKQLSNTSPRADGNTRTLAHGARKILIPKSPSQATGAQRAAVHENAESMPFSPASELKYVDKPGPSISYAVPPMPTLHTKSEEQQYGCQSSSWPSTDAVNSSGGTIQALVRTPISQSESSKQFSAFTQSNI